ncbi:hypothetical protein OKW76_06050 [Sphingomonas sp. S1-29]|uniref:cytochrome c3 family protein n=1 Tax=Sphingomonas sp. S1-29 TaxID=2991074 RepID=UPI00223F6C7E|nr:cytochrome c3 family protein [Sphingomonas sp. S1-29]UZK70595.1 hypothetical protein OKW76_06050 [Sphingomonas sp. S1-29]
MIRRWGLWLIAVNLGALIALSFAWPHLMVAPGPLVPAHARITGDCFACHAPFRGVSANRCATCHKVADIGIRTTRGVPVARRSSAIAFHQALRQPDCVACHTDHSGPRLVQASHQSFAHALLRLEVRGQCAACHRPPRTPLHAQAGRNCAACHSSTAWEPATFDHRRSFALTGPHNVSCATCHTGGDLTRNTCFGCHEHQPAQVRAEHAEEGIRNIDNCARCHRSGAGEQGGEREGDD